MVRFYTPSLDAACDALNLYDIDYDLDDGDRIMIDDSSTMMFSMHSRSMTLNTRRYKHAASQQNQS